MTNPVGFAWLQPEVGIVVDPLSIDELSVPGLVLTGGAALPSSDPEILSPQPSAISYDCGGAGQYVNMPPFTFGYTSSGAATSAATLAAEGIAYCYILHNWESGVVGSGSVMGSCPPVNDPGSIEMTVTMAGFGSLRFGVVDDGVMNSRSALATDPTTLIESGVQPEVFPSPNQIRAPEGLLLRPAPLVWPGQDPDNVANRAIWSTAEVADITYDGTAICVARPPGYGLVMLPSWFVMPMKQMIFPAACPIQEIPPMPPTVIPPGTLAAGNVETGIVRRGR